MSGNACAVPLCKWLCPSLQEIFNSPDSSDAETVKAGFLFCSRSRAMAGLPQANGADSLAQSPPFEQRITTTRVWSFCGGEGSPRQVHWRPSPAERKRAFNSSSVFAVYFETGTNMLKSGFSLRLNLRDVRDYFYLFQVDDKRLKRQIITSGARMLNQAS